MTKNSKKGFTLVELVVVIAILAILAAIAIPVVNSIINTASKNGALSNASTIELAVKEAQADIAAKNTEVYDGSTQYSFGDDVKIAKVTGATVHNAANAHGDVSVQDVAGAKGIADAFAVVTYNGTDYSPYWNKENAKCVFLDGSSKDLDGNAVAGTNTPLTTVASGCATVLDTVKIDGLKP